MNNAYRKMCLYLKELLSFNIISFLDISLNNINQTEHYTMNISDQKSDNNYD